VIDLGSSPGPPAANAEVVASFFTPDALYRVKATASRRDEQVAVLDLTVHEVERVQRRATPRARIEVPVALTAFDGPGEFATVRGDTMDLGPGGCRVRTQKAFPPGRDPTLSIQLPDGETLVVLAQVLQQQSESGHFDYRLAFMDVEDNDRKRLEELVAE
jgi:c-di-GMP-binding flagellar brake protein YcgR